MGGKINNYGFGRFGVNVDKDELHLDDGELRSAQNVQIDRAGVMGGIRKRDGFSKFTASALAGGITGILGVSLVNYATLSDHFYQGIDDDGLSATHNFRSSTVGTSGWGTIDLGVRPRQRYQIFGSTWITFPYFRALERYAVVNRKLYYPGNDYTKGSTTPTVHAFDGVTDNLLTRIPINPSTTNAVPPFGIFSIQPFSQYEILISTFDDGDTAKGRGRLIVCDVRDGRLRTLGPQTDKSDGYCVIPVIWQGRVWVFSWNNSGSNTIKVYAVRDGETTYTLDNSNLTGDSNYNRAVGGCVFKGELYVGVAAETAGHSAKIYKRDNAGTWTTVYTSSSTTALNHVGPFIVTQDGLTMLVFENTNDVTGSGTQTPNKQRILKTTDGATFTTDTDIAIIANNSYCAPGFPMVDPVSGKVYWPISKVGNGLGAGKGIVVVRDTLASYTIADGGTLGGTPVAMSGAFNKLRF